MTYPLRISLPIRLGKHLGVITMETRGKTEEALIQLQKVFNHSNVGITYVYIGIRNDEINDFYKNIKYRDDD